MEGLRRVVREDHRAVKSEGDNNPVFADDSARCLVELKHN